MVGFERLPTLIPKDVELTGLSLRETPATACFPRWVRGISHATWSVPDRLTGVTIAQDFNQSSGKEFQLFFNQMTAAVTGPAGVSDQYTVLTGETRRHCRAASGSEVTDSHGPKRTFRGHQPELSVDSDCRPKTVCLGHPLVGGGAARQLWEVPLLGVSILNSLKIGAPRHPTSPKPSRSTMVSAEDGAGLSAM